ncbi:prephenate dehydrogenase/arogenate dehydrogenase family protein [Telmatospirillum siberiense]|uniref:Prephenate dehydrogenase/arogenate dehydrogenase family protein n=1 Tax=Telmatospirillum siberiense TaxID=382514 RepID=A0A2N3PQQ6_9PROT|nr:prephenate dehydrogenase [Telmatospirillum siberiense]PKU22728.1 prephenate dehydrogenase/arogenate dehydrogenase family protein [Telmatospirillum siberiense]
MSDDHSLTVPRPLVGIIGFGAFGRLMARHLRPHFRLRAYDPAPPVEADADLADVALAPLQDVAACPVVILAMPLSRLEETVRAIGPHLSEGALVLDVGSVKMKAAEIMAAGLPDHAEIIATHPLFGPASAAGGIRGLKIALCPVRGRRSARVAAFLRKGLGLRVVMTTPEAHDAETAMAQGLTHLIAKVLVQMEPLPTRMTTKSFDLLKQAIDMVRNDAPEVFQAIECLNPYSPRIRKRFLDIAATLDQDLGPS